MSNSLENGTLMKKNATIPAVLKTDLTIEKALYGDRIARITEDETKNKGARRISIKHNHDTGSVSIHYRGKLIYVRGVCAGSLVITGNVILHNITVVGTIKQNP